MNEWYAQQDEDVDWQQQKLNEEEQQWLLEEKQKIALHVMQEMLKLAKPK